MVNPLFVKCLMYGRCYYQVAVGIPPGWRLADVIAKWQMEQPLFYVIFSSGMLNRTSSHICGRWTFGERFKEHQQAPSPIYDHYNITGHNIKLENFSIVGKEDQNLKRAIKEAMYIRANDPSLNRNVGKYHLPHIWDEVLFNIPELKIT